MELLNFGFEDGATLNNCQKMTSAFSVIPAQAGMTKYFLIVS